MLAHYLIGEMSASGGFVGNSDQKLAVIQQSCWPGKALGSCGKTGFPTQQE